MQPTSNISFASRNPELRYAEKIVRRIKTHFPASSAWLWNTKGQKAFGLDDRTVCVHLTNAKVSLVRDFAELTRSNYDYAAKMIELIKHYKAMNCLENSEIAYLLAKANGYEDVQRVALCDDVGGESVRNLGHSVLLLNSKAPQVSNVQDISGFSEISKEKTFLPDKKTIVIDPILGIVDYWQNAVLKYKNMYNDLLKIGEGKHTLRTITQNSILPNKNAILELKEEYPILDLSNKNPKYRRSYWFMHADEILKSVEKDYPPYRPVEIQTNIFVKMQNFFQEFISGTN